MMNQDQDVRTAAETFSETIDPVEAGKPIIAGYKIGKEMGQGPLGKIYRAAHTETGQRVVFRGFTKPAGADDAKWEAAKNQFRDLLAAHQRVEEHLNVQKILAFGEEDDLFWIAAEWFEARTLHQILTEEGAQTRRRTFDIFEQVARAVDSAGERGLSHTDLTPYNILLVNPPANEPNRIIVKVINFGLAHARRKYGSRYAAPEQLNGVEGDRRADVYAAGALLYEMLSGAPLRDGATPDAVAEQTRKGVVPPLPQQPEYVQKILGVMLHPDPRFRYANLSEAMADLNNKRIPEAFSAQGIVLDQPASAFADKPIALQSYQLSDQDVVIIRNQRDTTREDAAERQRERLTRNRRRYVSAGIASALVLLGIHAATLPGAYRRLRVAAVTGSPTLMRDGVKTPLHVGDEITDDKTPQIITQGNDTVILTAHDARLRVEPDSILEVAELNYNKGGVRRFALKRGMVLASVPARQRSAIFEIDGETPTGMGRTQIKSGQYAVFVDPHNVVMAAVLSGKAMAAMGDNRAALLAGQTATISGGISAGDVLPGNVRDRLEKGMAQMRDVPTTPAPVAAILNAEERMILPTVEGVQTALNLPAYLNDRKARMAALASMQMVCTFAGQNGESEIPGKVNLSTLEPLSIPAPDRTGLLRNFENDRLLSYRRLSDGGYEFLARAADSGRTLIRGRNGKARIAATDDLEDADGANPLTSLINHAGNAENL